MNQPVWNLSQSTRLVAYPLLVHIFMVLRTAGSWSFVINDPKRDQSYLVSKIVACDKNLLFAVSFRSRIFLTVFVWCFGLKLDFI